MNCKHVVKQMIAASAALFLMSAAPRAHAATFTIANGDVTGLKNALNTANTNNVADTINLAAGGTYTLTTVDNTINGSNGLPVIINDLAGQDLTINGNGATIQRSTASGTPSFRILGINIGAAVTLSGLTFTHALLNGATDLDAVGGALLNFGGTVTISNSTFTGNRATGEGGAILSGGGVMNLTNCTLTNNTTDNNGGAILNTGGIGVNSMTLNNCTVMNNSATINSSTDYDGEGGGISNESSGADSKLTINNSIISGNTVGGTYAQLIGGGGIESDTNSGGTTTLIVTNSLISSNSTGGSGGGIRNDGGLATITNCTISGNSTSGYGGGILNADSGATLTVHDCTLKDNSAGNGKGTDIGNLSGQTLAVVNLGNSIFSSGAPTLANGGGGTVTDQGYNLSSDNGGGFLTAATDQINTDPKLAALSNNGGPTQTFALLSGSPALDKGKSFGAATDQRGLTRPYDNPALANATGGDGSDIGAYETQAALPTLAVNNPRSLPEGNPGSPGSVTFDITLSAASTQSVTVNFQTHDGTNNPAIAGSDYKEKHGKITFAPGETDKRVTIAFIGDSTVELNETFFFDLSTPTNVTIADSRGVGQINNDDGPGITIDNAPVVTEPASGTASQTFTVTLSAASTDTITVNYATSDLSAKAGSDYVATSGVLTFAPGETSQKITVLVRGDSLSEPTETYRVVLSKVTYAYIADGIGIGTIRNNATSQVFEDEPSQ